MRNFLVASSYIFWISISAVLVACAIQPAVKTPEQAIAIGIKACDDSWGAMARRNGTPSVMHPELWHARLDGDRWKVWFGHDEKYTGMYIYVRRDGHPPDPEHDCEAVFTD